VLKPLIAFGLTRRPVILLLLAIFIGGGLLAFTRLNIEAYPNPAPVILEITAQSSGLSAEEMERLYTIPMEMGLAITPGLNNIRSTGSVSGVFNPLAPWGLLLPPKEHPTRFTIARPLSQHSIAVDRWETIYSVWIRV